MSKNKSFEALEICVNGCKHTCPYYNKDDCITLLKSDLLDAFKRQNADIEKLCMEINELIIAKDLLFDEAEALIKKSKAEAVNEFVAEINSIAKEMVGED